MLRISARRLASPVFRRAFSSIPEPGPVGLKAGDNPRVVSEIKSTETHRNRYSCILTVY